MRRCHAGEFATQNEAQNYPKRDNVDLTGRWRESLRPYPGRSDYKLSSACANAGEGTLTGDGYMV
jgi:hypothetical protein